MLKQTITYQDFDGVTQTEDLYFNMTQTDLTDNLGIQTRLETFMGAIEGGKRELSIPEVQEMLNLVKEFMRMSYGIRHSSKRFEKTPEIWAEFIQTAAFDAFLMSLFENQGEKAMDFLAAIMPTAIQPQVQAEMAKLKANGVFPTIETDGDLVAVTPQTPEEPSDEELLKMDPSKMTRPQLVRAMALKSQG